MRLEVSRSNHSGEFRNRQSLRPHAAVNNSALSYPQERSNASEGIVKTTSVIVLAHRWGLSGMLTFYLCLFFVLLPFISSSELLS